MIAPEVRDDLRKMMVKAGFPVGPSDVGLVFHRRYAYGCAISLFFTFEGSSNPFPSEDKVLVTSLADMMAEKHGLKRIALTLNATINDPSVDLTNVTRVVHVTLALA